MFERKHEGNSVTVPGVSFEIRYPSGDYEVDVSGQRSPPVVGDTIRRNGRLWKVITRTDVPAVIVRVELARMAQTSAARVG